MLVSQQHQATGRTIKTSSLFLFLSRGLLGAASGSTSSAATTPGILDTAFLNVSVICLLGDRHRYDLLFHRRKPTPMISTVKSACRRHKVNRTLLCRIEQLTLELCSLIGQTTQDASSTVYRMLDTILEQQSETIRSDSGNKTMVSTGTMPRTPVKMVSFGTMPSTPTALTSTGTMPGTPLMASTGTMPKTPTGLVTAATSFSLSDHGTIDLCSPTMPVIDHVSPGSETIDLCSPATPTNTPRSQ